jgi:hypothetical protein
LSDKKFVKLADTMGELADANIFIDDQAGQHINALRTKARRLALERGLDIIFVDYLQLMHGNTKESRTLEVGEISQGLKNKGRVVELADTRDSKSRASNSVRVQLPPRPFIENVGNIDFRIVWQIFLYGLAVFWFVVLYWVWLDSGDRTSNKASKISYVLLVASFEHNWFLIYLIIRPGQTIEEIYWADLERRYLKYETAELGDCPKCGRQLYPGYTFCPNCRNKIKRKCPKL